MPRAQARWHARLQELVGQGRSRDEGPIRLCRRRQHFLPQEEERWRVDGRRTQVRGAAGVSRDGRAPKLPMVRQRYFSRMTEQDLDAIVAWVRTIPPIE